MANPSDTGPSGVGTETLRRRYIDNSGEAEQIVCAGVANHIMTVISVVFCNASGPADTLFYMYLDYDLGGTDLHLLRAVSVPSNETYVFNDKIILTDTDRLLMIASSASGTAEMDVLCTYIDQEFTT